MSNEPITEAAVPCLPGSWIYLTLQGRCELPDVHPARLSGHRTRCGPGLLCSRHGPQVEGITMHTAQDNRKAKIKLGGSPESAHCANTES